MSTDHLKSELQDLVGTLAKFESLLPVVRDTGNLLIDCLQSGGKIMTAGNGGSAADALHLAEELVGRFSKSRRSLAAVSLVGDPTLLTCIGNDFGYDALFSRQVEGVSKPGDVLVVFTTSGNSENLIQAVQRGNELEVTTLALLGKDGGRLRGQAKHELIVPSHVTARIQEVHTLILHLWLSMIEEEDWG